MTVQAKFRCDSVTPHAGGAEIAMHAVTGGSVENESFFKYTPAGTIRLSIVSAETAAQFEPGKTYLVNFIEAAN